MFLSLKINVLNLSHYFLYECVSDTEKNLKKTFIFHHGIN
ncbi:hypothetical protein yrohd0001_34430 [Yersinia rohdei ATCC 43380]|nr:hypothetical protein yrohd0001_34430 [Yersinia rohdei ATCC 43380]